MTKIYSIKPDAALDCTGLYCPQPIIQTAARITAMKPGQILEVQATDPGFQIDLAAWCLSHRQGFLGVERKGNVFFGYVQLKHDAMGSSAPSAE